MSQAPHARRVAGTSPSRANSHAHSPSPRSLRALSTMLILMALIIYLNGCGGGGGAAAPTAQAPNNPQNATDLATAQKAYDGVPRTPPGFYADAAPPSVSGTVATVHLKNSDLAGAPFGAIAFELCSDNLSDATAWSEGKSQFMGSYADLVDVGGEARFWELTRVPRADVNSRLRHRVFKCSYVDRGSFEPAVDNGSGGTINSRPVDAVLLKNFVEYVWHYTAFNNADHVVLQSQPGLATSGSLAHDVTMAKLTRAVTASECDRVDVLRWTHTVNTASGAITRLLQSLQTIRARRPNGVVELC